MMSRRSFATVALLSWMLAAVPYAAAQDHPTVGVVSLGSFDEVMQNAAVVGEIMGLPNAQQMLEAQLAGITGGKGLEGLDKTKPIVLAVKLGDGIEPYAITCVPVTDLKQLLGSLPESLGQTEDVGDGVLQLVNAPEPTFVKEKDGWAYVAKEQEQLASAPENPQELAGDLAETYLIGIRGFVQNVPENKRTQLIGFLEALSEMGAINGADDDDGENQVIQQRMMRRQMQLAQQWLNETDEITIGLGLDQETKSVFLDIGMTAVDGSKTAREYARLKQTTSQHAGFLRDDAAVSITVSAHGVRAEEDLELLDAQHDVAKSRAIASINEDGGVPDAVKQDVQMVLGDLIDVAFDTLKAEKTEAGLALIINEKSSLVAGSSLSDGVKLEAAIQKLVEIISAEDELPPVEWGAENHGLYRIHVARIPVPDEAAQPFIGTQLEIAMAVNADSCYLAIGGDAVAEVKKTIDAAIANKETEINPVHVVVKLNEIMQAVAKQMPFGPVPVMVEATKDAGEIQLTSESIPGGVRTRLVVEKGVLQGVAQAVMLQMAGGGGQGGDAGGGQGGFGDEDLEKGDDVGDDF